jgi:hypothetical protein
MFAETDESLAEGSGMFAETDESRAEGLNVLDNLAAYCYCHSACCVCCKQNQQ